MGKNRFLAYVFSCFLFFGATVSSGLAQDESVRESGTVELVSRKEAKQYVLAHLREYERALLDAARSNADADSSFHLARGHLAHALIWAARVEDIYPRTTSFGEKLLDTGFGVGGFVVGGVGVAGSVVLGTAAGLAHFFDQPIGMYAAIAGAGASAYLGGMAARMGFELLRGVSGNARPDRLGAMVEERLVKFSARLKRTTRGRANGILEFHEKLISIVADLQAHQAEHAPEIAVRCRGILTAFKAK